MTTEVTNIGSRQQNMVRASFLAKTAIVVLLFSVAGLATLAKNGQYYPQSNPVHQVSVTIKMNLAHSPVHITGCELQRAATIVPTRLPMQVLRVASVPAPLVLRIGLTVSMQHRSPPSARA